MPLKIDGRMTTILLACVALTILITIASVEVDKNTPKITQESALNFSVKYIRLHDYHFRDYGMDWTLEPFSWYNTSDNQAVIKYHYIDRYNETYEDMLIFYYGAIDVDRFVSVRLAGSSGAV